MALILQSRKHIFNIFSKRLFEQANSFVIFGKLCFNRNTMTTDKQTQSATENRAAPAQPRLRVQPLAHDTFSTLAYACIMGLLCFEFLALFWLDIF
jgi:hypothetical protein